MSLRRLIDLLVKSVDLVDNPANQQPFLVVKNAEQEDSNMKTVSNIETDAATESAVSSQLAGTASNDIPAEIQKALDEADEIFKSDTKLAEKLHEAVKRAVDEVVVEKAMDPAKAAAAIDQAVKLCEQMAKIDGVPGPAKMVCGRIAGILAKLKGNGAGYGAPKQAACAQPGEKVKKDTEIEKAVDQPAIEPAPPVATPPAQPVEKAGAKMAQANMETLMNGIETLNQGVETLKKLAAAMMPPKKDEPPVAAPGEEDRKQDPGYGAPPVKKDETAPVTAAVEKETAPAPAAPAAPAPAPAPAAPAANPLDEVTKSLGAINDRLAKIEGNVGPGSKQATSSKPEGDAAGKVEKSFWSGLI